MSLAFLNDTPKTAFRKLERDLLLVNPEVKLGAFKGMTPRALGEELAKLDARRAAMLAENTYGAWLQSEDFVELQLMREALTFLKEYKEGRREEEHLVPGFSYYRRVKQYGTDMTGLRCYFQEGVSPMWVPWKMDLNVAKAFEVIRHGDQNDFRRIYVEMANGTLNPLGKVTVEHLTESDEDSLASIGEYCDSRWDGPWPWEAPSPYTLRETIEERDEMNLQTANEMQAQFNNLLRRLDEEEMDKYSAIASAEEMAETIQKMVEQIARLAGEGIIKLKDQLRVTMGDEAASQIEDTFLDPVRQAADSLSTLRATILDTVSKLKAGDAATDVAGAAALDTAADMGAAAGADASLGSPADAMGAPPVDGDELAGDLADASLDGSDGERPLKTM